MQLLVKVDHQWRHEHVFVAQPNGQYVSANRDWQIATGDLDDWSDASDYCASLSLGNLTSGWRLARMRFGECE